MTTTTTETRKHIFGPIPSRLFGRALGVDPFGRKVCNFSCVYCHLGQLTPSATPRQLFGASADILEEVEQALAAERSTCDWITISGLGEPTLHPKLGDVIRGIKQRTTIPVAVFTNGSLLGLADTQAALATADAVVVTIDAGDATEFRFINRAHRSVSFDDHVDGIIRFRNQFQNRLFAQVMLVPGVNDSIDSLMKIRGVLARVRPTEIFVTEASRPPTEAWVGLPNRTGIERARTALEATARKSYAAPGAPRRSESLPDRIHEILLRHPMTQSELQWWFQDHRGGEVDRALDVLKREQLAGRTERGGDVYWTRRVLPAPARAPRPRPQRPRAVSCD